MEFTNEEKNALFDKIAALYFNKNFGSTSKADFETLLFSEYIEHCLRSELPFDDYTISKNLGITQSRVRSLKERKELKYPYKEFTWRTAFALAVEKAKYDEHDHYVKFIIQDINVMNEARHFIEEKGWYDECSLNRKLLRIPLDCFTEICLEDEAISELFSTEAKRRIKKIANSDSAIMDFLNDFSKDGLKSFLMSAGKEALISVISCLPFGGIAKVAFSFLERAIKGV